MCWNDEASAVVAAIPFAAKLFIPVWLIVAAVNMWIGVARAGYSVVAELPILLVVFAVPAVVALVVIWQVARE